MMVFGKFDKSEISVKILIIIISNQSARPPIIQIIIHVWLIFMCKSL